MSCVGYMSCMRYAVGDYMGLGSGQTPGIIHRASPGLRVVSSASGFSVRNCDRVIPYLSCTRRPGVTLMLITLSLSPPPSPPLSDHSLSLSLSLSVLGRTQQSSESVATRGTRQGQRIRSTPTTSRHSQATAEALAPRCTEALAPQLHAPSASQARAGVGGKEGRA